MRSAFEDAIAALPQRLEPEFVMASPNSPICLVMGRFDLLRAGRLLGHLDGEIALEWLPRLSVVCTGESDTAFGMIVDDRPLQVAVPQLGLTAEVLVTGEARGKRPRIRALLSGVENAAVEVGQKFRFYLANFPDFRGKAVRVGSERFAGARCDRLEMKAGPLVCTIDRVDDTGHLTATKSKPGFLLTHVAEVERLDGPFSPSEVHELLEALRWLLAFIRGARTGPVLPSVGQPFAKQWISIGPWSIDEPRLVNSWFPTHSPIELNGLFVGFTTRWSDPVWKDGLKATIAWYLAANAPGTPNEARVLLCQIALEVLASLQGLESGNASERIRTLLEALRIPTQVPPRLSSLKKFAASFQGDAAACLTRIRNKLEHPTAANRQNLGAVDGVTLMQAGQYGIELFELSLLAMMSYRGKYARRAFQGWKGDDEIPVPWARA